MAGKFTKEEIDALYAPFPLKAHSIREGNKNKAGTRIRWYVYLDRVAVQTKLDELFIGDWSFDPIEGMTNRQANYVNITATLTIRGVSRSFNGGSGHVGNRDPDEDLEKGAMTDTFRRVASLWGLGAYLYNSVEIWTAAYEKGDWTRRQALELEAKRAFRDWYNAKFPEMIETTNEGMKSDKPDNGQAEEPESMPESDATTLESATRFMFDTDDEQIEMLTFLRTSNTIKDNTTLPEAVSMVLRTRASQKHGQTPGQIIEMINKLGKGQFATYTAFIEAGHTPQEVWEGIEAFAQLGTQSRTTNGKGKRSLAQITKDKARETSKATDPKPSAPDPAA